MINLMDAAQLGAFALLDGRAPLKALCQVTQHVKQDMLDAGAITRIGKIESKPEGGKGEQVELIFLDLETIYRGKSQAAVLAIMHEQRQALEGQSYEAEGIELDTFEWEQAMVDGPADDGVTYVGIQTFSVFAQPA